MIEQGLFKRHFTGRDGFIWWIGQVVSQKEWITNIPGKHTATTKDHQGFDYRYKVRIMGYHTADKNELPDRDLPWASVMLPVTAGGGTGGITETPTIAQGNFVYGFFLDGEDAQQPIIMGIIGYNQYSSIDDLPIGPVAFKPFNSFEKGVDNVPKYTLRTTPETPAAGTATTSTTQAGTATTSTSSSSGKDIEGKGKGGEQVKGTVGSTGNEEGASQGNKERGEKQYCLAKPTTCEKLPLGKIQKEMLNTIKEIQKARESVSSWKASVSTEIGEWQEFLEEKVKWLTDKIAEGAEWIVLQIQKYTVRLIEEKAKAFYFTLFPAAREGPFRDGVNTAMDLLICNFRKILKNIYKLVFKLLIGVIDKVVNVAECFVQDFLANILSSILNDILSAVTGALDVINGLVGGVLDIADSILGIVIDIFSYLTCIEEPECPQIDSWSVWNGPDKNSTFDFNSLFDQVKTLGEKFKNVPGDALAIVDNTVNSITGTIGNAINGFDVSPLGGTCGVGPLLCGPPTVEFFGGGGSGASAEAYVNLAGEIMGVNIISGGDGYTGSPFVKFKDDCGRGTGAVGRVITCKKTKKTPNDEKPPLGGDNGKDGCLNYEEDDLDEREICNVVIIQPGYGYLPKEDGSNGGGERTYGDKDQTIVRRSDGCYDLPYDPGEQIDVNPGDWVKYPCESPFKVEEVQTITAKKCPDQPVDDKIEPFIPIVDDIYIDNPGNNYEPGDCIIVTSTGECIGVVTSVTPNGSIVKVDTYKSDSQYFTFPNIIIDSKNGINGKVYPIFSFRTDDNFISSRTDDNLQQGTGLVTTVVDCVGKVPTPTC